jgi:autotransporter-associated beta strand protein
VTGSGASYTVTAKGVAGAGTIGLNLVDNNSIRDSTTNPLVSSNAALSLQGQQTFATGTGPQSVAVGDFNKDGNLDLVAANYGTFVSPGNTLSVLLGKGDGTFGAQKTFAVGTLPSSVAVGDINQDGKPDLVATNYFSGTLSVLLGKGDGTFGDQQTFATGISPTSVAIGDMNQDGKPDLAVANFGSNTVGMFLNTTSKNAAAASFNGQATYAVGSGPRSVSIYIDDRFDTIIVSNYGTSGGGSTVTVNFFKFSGPTAPASTVSSDYPAGSGPYSVAVSNFFGVITANYGTAGGGSTISTGIASTPSTYATGKGPAAVVVGDYNCDGTPDIAVANSIDGTLGVLLGNSDKTLQAQQTFAVGTNPQALASGDFNNDGRLDLVAANLGLFGSGNSLSVLLNGQTGNFTGAVATVDTIAPSVQSISLVGSAVTNATSISWAVTFSEPVTGVDAGDFAVALSGVTAALPLALTGSGTSYTVTANTVAGAGTIGLNLVSDGTIRDQVNNPMVSGSFKGAVATVDPILPFVQSISLVSSSPTTASSISWAVTFSEPVTGVDAGDFAVALSGVTAAPSLQVTGSGTSYTVTATTVAGTGTIGLNLIDNGTIRDQANNPLGNPAAPASYATPVTFAIGASPTVIATGDLNNDGRPDLAFLQISAGAVSVLLNTTAPGDATPTYAPEVTFAVGASPISLAIGDLNGDGRPDLAITNFNSSAVSVLLNTTGTKATTPSYAPRATFATGTDTRAVAIGDLNGDGKPDLAVANYSSNNLSVLLSTTATNATSPSYAAQVTVYGGGSPTSVAICDLNADGKADLVVANRNSNTMTVLLSTNATTPAYAAPATFATGTNPNSISIGDLNADGRPDIAVNNANSASVSVYLNTMGANATKASYANPVVFSTGQFPQAISIGDLNGDGRLDLAFATAGDSVANVLLSTTATGATAPSYASPATFAAGSVLRSVIGDFNGDGRTDLAIASPFSDAVSLLLGNQTGSFTGAVATIGVAPTDSITVSNGQTVSDPDVRTGTYKLVKRGGGTLILNQANTHSGGTVVEAGTLVVKNASALGTGLVHVKAGASLVIDPTAGEVIASSLVVDDGGFVDLSTGRMRILSGASAGSIVPQILAAQGNGSWTAPTGIGSSSVASAATRGLQRRIGWLDNGDGSFTIAFAAPGDSNLDAVVDILDVSNLLGGGRFDASVTASWSDGDFTYDSVCDILDVAEFISVALYDTGDYLVAGSAPANTANVAEQADVAPTITSTDSLTEAAFAAFVTEQQPTTARKKPFSRIH